MRSRLCGEQEAEKRDAARHQRPGREEIVFNEKPGEDGCHDLRDGSEGLSESEDDSLLLFRGFLGDEAGHRGPENARSVGRDGTNAEQGRDAADEPQRAISDCRAEEPGPDEFWFTEPFDQASNEPTPEDDAEESRVREDVADLFGAEG